jgi:hypothetical protein
MADTNYDQDQSRAGEQGSQDEAHTSTERIQQEFRRARADTEAVFEDLRNLREELAAVLRERLQNQPYLMLGASVGIGYVLGGGLPKGSPALAMGLATRMAATWLVREVGGSGLSSSSDAAEEEY